MPKGRHIDESFRNTENPVFGKLYIPKKIRRFIMRMKNTHRLLSGLISSLLLCMGFIRAAEYLDPLHSSDCQKDKHSLNSAACCVPCIGRLD
jgi:hypothetical protein